MEPPVKISLDPLQDQHLQFEYTNWRGDDHEYVIRLESITFGHYNEDTLEYWYLHGNVIRRDGEVRKDQPRRSFKMEFIRDPKVI